MKDLTTALDHFYKEDRLALALQALHNLGKLWHLDDDPAECGFSDDEVVVLRKFQEDVFIFANKENVSPFDFYPNIEE